MFRRVWSCAAGASETRRAAATKNRCAQSDHYLARRVGTQTADDLVAEAFLVFWEKRGDYDPSRASAKSWLYGIATNAQVLADQLADEVAALCPEERDVLLLTAWADLSPTKIAEATGVAV
ncbi:RNA polymerase sigma factor [Amycolatopsis magusensis]|uniref:RNA polymerase sigma factor n=1 Tax=Amycolatopsis magusensis TaxID=882444 RepID=UPI0037BD275C